MLVYRVGKVMALWGTVLALSTHAYFRSVAASTIDSRFVWGLPVILGALLLGHLLAWASGRLRGVPLPALDADRHGLCFLVVALCIDAFSHVEPQTSIRVLREELPPILGWIYPGIALATPIMLRITAARRSAADQGLWIVLALSSLSGALVLMNAPTALCLGFVALMLQLDAGRGRLPRNLLLTLATLVVALLLIGSWVGANPFHAAPSRAWILAAACGGLAVAIRPRKAADWRWILSAPLAAAVLVALSGLVITAYLGVNVDWQPALRTRLTLFRQHPNFLAPFLAFQSLVALGLAFSGKRFRIPALASSALLAGSTIMTDSRTGQGALALALLTLPVVYGLTVLARRFRLRVLFIVAVGIPALIGAVLFTQRGPEFGDQALEMASHLERFDKSMEYRIDAWRNSLEIIGDNPLLGIGPGTFVSKRRFEPGSRFFNEAESPHPHNVLLYVGQAAGIPAAVIFVFWIIVLLQSLWHGFQWGPAPAPRFLMATLIAATIGLVAASLLDLGLALHTVVPAPLFLLTGLLVGSATRHERRRREGPALLWTVPIALLLVPYGLNAVRARAGLEQSKLMWYLAGQRRGDTNLHRESARRALAAAIELDEDLYPAYDLLARWTESGDNGFLLAQEILQSLVGRADSYGPSLSQLGHLYMRHQMYTEAADWLQRSLECSHGSVYLTRDRADIITCLARLGRRQECLSEIASSLRMGVGIVDDLPFVHQPESGEYVLPLGGPEQRIPIRLVEAVEVLFARNVAEEEAGRPVGRRFWMDTYSAFRRAGHDEQALMVLDYIDTEEVFDEPHTIAYERGRLAMDSGDLESALSFFERASEVAPSHAVPYFRTEVSHVRQLMGETGSAAEQSEAAFAATEEILDNPASFLTNLDLQVTVEMQRGSPAAAARILERTLLFVDDIEQRGLRWERIGTMYASDGHEEDAVRAFGYALEHLTSKPYGLPSLQLGQAHSVPGRIGFTLCAVWRAQGLDAQGIQRAAWNLPGFFSPRLGWSLLRMAIFAENGQPDALLREADLQLLRDPYNSLAMWARLDAIEGLGKWHSVRDNMRDIAETFAMLYSVDEIYRQAVIFGQSNMDDPISWFEIAILDLLRGKYPEAADLFGLAYNRLPNDPHQAAHVLGWQARATHLANRLRARHETRTLLQKGLQLAPECGLLRMRLNGLPE
jgi:O-antigen ligase/tetratricopeptide (TPR) repeat protein